MAEPVPLSAIPRPELYEEYDVEAMEHSFQAVELDLSEKFDRRSNLILDPGKELVLTADDSSAMYGLGINSSGLLRILDYSDGTIGTFTVAWAQVDGAAQEITNLTAYVDSADATLLGSITMNAASIVVNGSAISGIQTEITAARDGEASLTAKLSSIETAYVSADSAAASDRTLIRSEFAAADTVAVATANSYTDTEVTAEGTARATAVDTVEARMDARASGAGQLLPNWNFQELDSDGKPAGINIVESASGRTQIEASSVGLKVLGSPDSTIGVGFPAVPIDDEVEYKVTVRHKSSASSASGLYLRLNETSGVLADGDTHVGASTGGSHVKVKTSVKDLVSNGAMPGTTLVESTYTYTPTAGTRFASFSLYSWAGFTGDYEVESVQITPTLSASVGVLKEAFVDSNGNAIARFVVEAAAGSDPARIGLRASDGSTQVLLEGDQIFLGANAEFETTDNTFIIEENGKRNRFGSSFGASGDLLEWFGPTSVAQGSETKTNGYFAKGTDGIVYFGSSAVGLTSATANKERVSYVGSANPQVTDSVTVTPLGGDGTYTYSWAKVFGDDYTITSATSASTTFSTTTNDIDRNAIYRCTVTETSTGNKASVDVGVGTYYI